MIYLEMQNKRIIWIDIAKGIAIMLVVVGHAAVSHSLANFIFAFHMPLFFIASGLTTNWNKHNIKDFCLHKIRYLLLPFALYSVLVLTIKLIILGDCDMKAWLLMGWQGYALWFVPVLFLSLILARMIASVHNKVYVIVIAILMAMMGGILNHYGVLLPWTLSTIPYATFLTIMGFIAKPYVQKFKPRYVMLMLCICLTIASSHYFRLDMAWNKIMPLVPITIGAISGTLMVFCLSYYISKHTKLISQIFQKLGRETFAIMSFSQITIVVINQYLSVNFVVKYTLMTLVMAIFVYLKNCLNRLCGSKIL